VEWDIISHPTWNASLRYLVKFNYRFSRNLLLCLSVKKLENRLAFGKNSDKFFRIRRILPLRHKCGHSVLPLLYFFFSLCLWSPRCDAIATRKFTTWLHLCGIFKCFNSKLIALPISTRLPQNRSFSAVFQWGVVWCNLFHHLLLRSYLYHCVWSVITAHNLTPEKRDNNSSPHPLTPTTCLRSTFKL